MFRTLSALSIVLAVAVSNPAQADTITSPDLAFHAELTAPTLMTPTELSAQVVPAVGGGELLLMPVADVATKAKRPWLAAGLNWFFPGAGYIYTGERRALGVVFLAGAVGLTLVEQSDAVPFLDPGLRESNPQLFGMMFASILVMNTAFAIDAYNEAKALNEGQATAPRRSRSWAVAPTAMDGGDKAAYGLAFSARY